MKLVKGQRIEGFGRRLAQIRKSRGLSQTELGRRVGVSKRVIVYYESENAQPPGGMLVDLARELHVSADVLLGLKLIKEKPAPRSNRLMKRLQMIEKLRPADQRAVMKFLDAFLTRQTASASAES